MDLMARCHSTIRHAPFQNHWLMEQMHFAINTRLLPCFSRHMTVYLDLSKQLVFISKLTVHMFLRDGQRSLVKLTSEIAQLSNARTHFSNETS